MVDTSRFETITKERYGRRKYRESKQNLDEKCVKYGWTKA